MATCFPFFASGAVTELVPYSDTSTNMGAGLGIGGATGVDGNRDSFNFTSTYSVTNVSVVICQNGVGTGVMTPLLFNSTGELIAVGMEYDTSLITAAFPNENQTIFLNFTSPVPLSAGDYWFGFNVSSTNTLVIVANANHPSEEGEILQAGPVWNDWNVFTGSLWGFEGVATTTSTTSSSTTTSSTTTVTNTTSTAVTPSPTPTGQADVSFSLILVFLFGISLIMFIVGLLISNSIICVPVFIISGLIFVLLGVAFPALTDVESSFLSWIFFAVAGVPFILSGMRAFTYWQMKQKNPWEDDY